MNDNLYRNIDGVLQRNSWYASTDPAVRSRYGLYETLLYREGRLQRADLHWQRLLKGLKQLQFKLPDHYHADYFTDQVQRLVRANGLEQLARIRLQVCARDIRLPKDPVFYIESFPLDPSIVTYNTEGITAGILEPYRKPLRPDSNLKLSHNTYAAPAAAAVLQQGWDEVLLRNEKGNICESAIANIFLVVDKEIITPPLSEGCLAGVMRAWLMPRLSAAGYTLREAPVTEEMLLRAEELFLTNSIRPLRWVGRLQNRVLGKQISAAIHAQGLLEE